MCTHKSWNLSRDKSAVNTSTRPITCKGQMQKKMCDTLTFQKPVLVSICTSLKCKISPPHTRNHTHTPTPTHRIYVCLQVHPIAFTFVSNINNINALCALFLYHCSLTSMCLCPGSHVFMFHVFEQSQLSVSPLGKELCLEGPVKLLDRHFGSRPQILC